MLAQEITHLTKKPNIGSNVIIKFDMAKAYDIISRAYICLVLRKMRFRKHSQIKCGEPWLIFFTIL